MKKWISIFSLSLVFLFSCSKDNTDNIGLTTSEKTLNYGDTYQIEATSESTISYTVENEYHASISETGLVTAGYVGETDITLSNAEDSKVFKLTVSPTSNLYPEPEEKYGTSKSEIEAEYGTPDSETSSVILYSDYSTNAPFVMFSFDTNDKLIGYAVIVKTAYSSELGTFLNERYVYVGQSDDTYVFMNALSSDDATMAIGLQLYNTSYWETIYAFVNTDPGTKSAIKSTVKTDRIDSLKENFKKCLELKN